MENLFPLTRGSLKKEHYAALSLKKGSLSSTREMKIYIELILKNKLSTDAIPDLFSKKKSRLENTPNLLKCSRIGFWIYATFRIKFSTCPAIKSPNTLEAFSWELLIFTL